MLALDDLNFKILLHCISRFHCFYIPISGLLSNIYVTLKFVRAAKRSYMNRFLNPELPAKTLWQNLRTVGAAKNPLDTGPVIFSPDELNCYYSSDIVTDPPVYTPSAQTPQSEGFNFRMASISTTKRAIRGIRTNAIIIILKKPETVSVYVYI
jgi:hypothetical protein